MATRAWRESRHLRRPGLFAEPARCRRGEEDAAPQEGTREPACAPRGRAGRDLARLPRSFQRWLFQSAADLCQELIPGERLRQERNLELRQAVLRQHLGWMGGHVED